MEWIIRIAVVVIIGLTPRSLKNRFVALDPLRPGNRSHWCNEDEPSEFADHQDNRFQCEARIQLAAANCEFGATIPGEARSVSFERRLCFHIFTLSGSAVAPCHLLYRFTAT